MRARLPDIEGFAEREGVKIAFEVHGADQLPTVLLLPAWSIVHSRMWKAQVPYLSRHFRVVTFDGRGNGRSDRPVGAAAYTDDEFVADIGAVLDATGTERATLIGLSSGAAWGVLFAARHPERVTGLMAIGASYADVDDRHLQTGVWSAELDEHDGWTAYNRSHWLGGGFDDFVSFFFDEMFPEPHSTKAKEDAVGWAHELTPATLADTTAGRLGIEAPSPPDIRAAARQLQCEVLVLHGSDDTVCHPSMGRRLADDADAPLITLEGSGHGPPMRDPVLVNLLIKQFVERTAPGVGQSDRRWTRALRRPKRALYLSSPIGLGHARRDLAIARELKALHPDLEIDWLAQAPVTRVLDDAGERVHPASASLASESAHIEDECADHDLHAFQAIRRMDEILVNNFMVFHDLVEAQHYDLVIGDEAWDVDYFLHENPELKRFAFAWMTDFVGWLPCPTAATRRWRWRLTTTPR
jgi:pimeloyl-ACP methyl ester carboxylesterase